MTSTVALPQGRARKGFSLVELSVVVIIIGVLAAFGVPRLLQSVERSKASESFKYLSAVRAAVGDAYEIFTDGNQGFSLSEAIRRAAFPSRPRR